MSIERDYRPQQFEAQPDDRTNQGETGTLFSGEQPENPEIHYDDTPTITVRLVNGLQQDVPHLFVDSRDGQTRWWVERESIESWQEQVQAAKESGDARYTDISPDRIPSSVVHTYPNIPSDVLQSQPAYENREWVTLAYSLSPNQEGEIDEYTFLNTPAVSEDETMSFTRSVTVSTWIEITQEVESNPQA